MSDRNASFFGPVVRQDEETSAFTGSELAAVVAHRAEADAQRTRPSAWPARRRFETLLPPPPVTH